MVITANLMLAFSLGVLMGRMMHQTVPAVAEKRKHDIQWNPTTKEWFCIRCFRISDHLTRVDAERELSQFQCKVASGGDGNGLPVGVH